MLDIVGVKLRFLLLQFMLMVGLVALYFQGFLQKIFNGDSRYFCAVVLLMGAAGLFHVFRARYADATWYADILIRIGVMGTIVGCNAALGAIGTAVLSGTDISKVLGVFLGSMGIAFFVSLCAIASNVWIEANIYFLRGLEDEDA